MNPTPKSRIPGTPTPAHTIAIQIERDTLEHLEDSYLAALWHTAQINPAPFGDREACEIAERIGREIIRRFLAAAPPLLWVHQGTHINPASGTKASDAFIGTTNETRIEIRGY